MTRLPPARLRIVASFVALGLCGPALSCQDASAPSHAAEPPKRGERDALKVATTTLTPGRIERYYRTSGTLRALKSAEIVASQPAVIKSLTVQEGDRVKAGQVIVRLDGRERALQAAAATMVAENLQAELRRLESVQPGAVSIEEIDKQRYAVQEAKVSARLSKHQATQMTVRAPFSGTVIARYVDPGTLATTNTPLLSLANIDTLELDLFLPEKDAATVKLDSNVEIELVSGTKFTATIARKAPIVDALTGTVKFTVRASEFPDTAMPGAFARANVLLDARQDAPSLPRKSVFETDGAPHVFVIEQGRAHRVPVKLGLEGSDAVEILEGLTPDSVVVKEGNRGVTEGMPLQPVAAATAAAPDTREDA